MTGPRRESVVPYAFPDRVHLRQVQVEWCHCWRLEAHSDRFASSSKVKEDMSRIYVGSLPWSLSSEDLYEAFAQFGEIYNAIVLVDRETRRSRGYGFVDFSEQEAAERALNHMDGQELGGRIIKVTFANERDGERHGHTWSRGRDGERHD